MNIKNINPEDKQTWEGKFLVEMDVDWAPEEIIEDTIYLLEKYQVPATFFATGKSAALSNIANNELYDVGIHPNFVPLLKGDHSAGADYQEVIDRLMDIFPDAKSTKAHSLVDSSLLLKHYGDVGITHDNSYLIDAPEMGPLVPWRLWNNLVRVPLFWEDDYACVTKYQHNFDDFLEAHKGLRVFGFHPLHVFLNTESLDRYEAVKKFTDDPKRLLESRFAGEGTRSRFIKLLKNLSKHG